MQLLGEARHGAMPESHEAVAVAATTATTATTAPRFRPDDNEPLPLPEVVSSFQAWLDQGSHLFNLQRRNPTQALCLASETGHADIVANLLAEQVDADAVADASGNTLLMLAAAAGHADVVEQLLQSGNVDRERRNGAGDSALLLAVANNHPDVVAVLIRSGAKINPSPFQDGTSLLAFAAGEGHLEIVKILLAQPQGTLDTPCTAGGPLIMAASRNRVEVVAYLLEAGANCNCRRPGDDRTALISATMAGHVGVVRLLVAQDGIDLKLTERNSVLTALSLAVIYGRQEVIECLLAAGAPRFQLDGAGCEELQTALSLKHPGTLEMFIRHGHIPQDANLDFGNPDEIEYVTVSADLSADRRLSGLMLPADARGASYFKQMFDVFDKHRSDQYELQWLREQGMSMACARQVIAALAGLRKELTTQGASAQLLDLSCLSALHRSSTPDIESRMTHPYRAAGISAEGVKRLETRAIWQLNQIARLAEVTLKTAFEKMVDDLINICVEKTGLDGQVRIDSLSARLCKNGYVKPLAEAIAASWRAALTAVQGDLLAGKTANPTANMAITMTYAHITSQAPTPFVRELLLRLGPGEESAEAQAMSGGQVDEILQPVFAFQYEALRKKCLSHVETQASANAPAPQQ
jgi:ankyrin repeat protein